MDEGGETSDDDDCDDDDADADDDDDAVGAVRYEHLSLIHI